MNTSELILRTRDALNEPSTSSTWTEAEILRYINDNYVSLANEAIQRNPTYFQRDLTLLGSEATLKSNREYEYRLPFPIEKVIDLRGDRTTGKQGESIPTIHMKDGLYQGWTFAGYNTFRVRGEFAGKDLCMTVQARPARLTSGTVPHNSDTCDSMYMGASTSVYPVEHTRDIYAGAIFQLTGTAAGDHRPIGQYNVVSSSEPHVKATDNNYYTNLTFQSDWETEPRLGDTYAMIPALPESTHLLIALKAARDAYHKTRNLAGMETIDPRIAEEYRRFTEMLSDRDSQGPEFIPSSNPLGYSEDLDKDPSFQNYLGY